MAGIGSVPERVRHGDRPQCVGRPVHSAKDPYAEAVTQQTADDHDGEQVEGERPQPEPERSVGAKERHDEVDKAQLRVGIEEQQRHVQYHEERSSQRGETMNVGDGESRQHNQRTARPRGDAQTSETVMKASAVTPVPRPSAHSAWSVIGRPRSSVGHPPMVWTLRSLSTIRAGKPSARIQSSARRPRMIAAVLTVLAAKQVCAATLTVRHTGSADRPVRGSAMWWTSRPASPPTANRARRGQRGARRQRHRTRRIVGVVVHEYLPAAVGRRSRGGDVTTQIDEHATAGDQVDAIGATVRGDRLGRRSEVEHHPGWHGHDAIRRV